MKTYLADLWHGRLPLAVAFWHAAIIYGSLANLLATIAAFAVTASGLPAVLAVVLFLLPLPYNIAAAVGVWRSSARYAGPQIWVGLARGAIIVWAIAATAL